MCNRARDRQNVETIQEEYDTSWTTPRPMDNRFNPEELVPKGRAWVVRQQDGARGIDVMAWDVLAGSASYPMTNVRNLKLPQWRRLAADPSRRCLVPLTEFCEWTAQPIDLGDGRKPIRGEMWFGVTDRPSFAVAGFWQEMDGQRWFAMVTCDANELVRPVHPKAMVTILHREDHERWLTGSYDDVVALQKPYPADLMTVRGPEFPTRSARRSGSF